MFLDLLTDANPRITKIVNKNLQVFFMSWINEWNLKQIVTPVSDGQIKKEDNDFSKQIEPIKTR